MFVSIASAQVPDATPALPPPAAAPAAPAAGASKQPGFLGRDVPAFDPGSEVMSWDGRNWNVNNNRLFQARFEKYLNAPEETSASDRQYQAIISEVLARLSPGYATKENVDYAFRLLSSAANFDTDARLSAALADSVYTVWLAQRQQKRLTAANEALRFSRHSAYFKLATSNTGGSLEESKTTSTTSKTATGDQTVSNTVKSAAQQGRAAVELAELEAAIKANEAKRALSEIQAKIEFQALMFQFFLQRRYQHVLIASRFYRALFADGDSKLTLGKDATELFDRGTGQPPTVSTLDSLANEAIRDVREGVKAFEFLLEKSELDSATKRLAESFTIGEFMPEIRTLPREKKRRVVDFSHKSFQLISALDVKDYTLAESLVKDLAVTAKDFDSSKPIAKIETSRQIAKFQIAKARNAAISGDRPALEAALTAATEEWPRNPELAEASKLIFSQGDIQQKAVVDFDQLVSQKNYRQIYNESGRFIAALATYPERRTELEKVLGHVKAIETALLRAEEMARQSNYPGAWESVEKAFKDFPDDTQLNQQRASLTTQAADFVRTLRTAQDLEKQDQVGSSLAWYLKAQKIYPQSDYAGEAIGRLVKRILPEG
jgi:tetratricopeptide (TPR) repeat protein